MRFFARSTATVALALALAACGSKEEAKLDKGQVLATVNGIDITSNEVNAELLGAQLPAAGEQRKAVEQQTLQSLVTRTILAGIARERNLDKSPIYIAQQRRAEENLLAQLLQREIASKVSPVTPAEAQRFMDSNPVLFADRKIYELDQIQFEPPKDMSKLNAYEPLDTMEEIALQLDRDGLKYRRAPGTLDPTTTNPGILKILLSKAEGEIFVIPANGALVATRIVGTKPEPLTGEKAIPIAMQLVQQRKIAEATEKQLADRVKKARESVTYQEGYAPPKAAASAPVAPAVPAPSGG